MSPEFISVIAICCLSLLFFGFNIYIVIRTLNVDKKINKFSDKHFVIDNANEAVKIVDKKFLSEVRLVSLNTFYRLFDAESAKNVLNTIGKTFENVEDTQKIIEVDSSLKFNSSKRYFSVLEISSTNLSKELLHINEYFFKYIPPKHINDPKKKRKYSKTFNLTKNDIDLLFRQNKNFKGASFMFCITIMLHLNSSISTTFINYNFYNILAKYYKGKIIEDFTNDSFITHDFKFSTREAVLKYISLIRRDFNIFLEMNNLSNDVRLNIGVVEHKFFAGDYGAVLKNLKQFANEAVSANKPYLFYDVNANPSSFFYDQAYKTEAESVVLNKKMDYYFEPILDCQNYSLIGYYCSLKPTSSVFSSFSELKQYAFKLGLMKKLFLETMRFIVQKTLNESISNTKQAIFVNILFFELDNILANLKYIAHFKEVNICFIFNEEDILQHLTSENVISKMETLSQTAFIGLEVTDKNSVLPEKIYSMFSFFFFNSPIIDNSKSASHTSFVLRKSIEKVLPFKGIVVLRGVKTMNDVEVRLLSELRYLSGQAIGPAKEMFIPVDKKVIERIKRINMKSKKE